MVLELDWHGRLCNSDAVPNGYIQLLGVGGGEGDLSLQTGAVIFPNTSENNNRPNCIKKNHDVVP